MIKEEGIEIKRIRSQTNCNNDFRCCNNGSRNRCKAKIVGDGQLLDCSDCDAGCCLRANPDACNYRTSFGSGHFCSCPVQIYAVLHPNH